MLSSLVLTWLEDLVLQLRHHLGDEGRVGVDEEWDGGDQGPAVVVDHVLSQPVRELAQDRLLVEELALVAVLEVLRDPLPHVTWQLPANWKVFGAMSSLYMYTMNQNRQGWGRYFQIAS